MNEFLTAGKITFAKGKDNSSGIDCLIPVIDNKKLQDVFFVEISTKSGELPVLTIKLHLTNGIIIND
jgi:hypothetical protein